MNRRDFLSGAAALGTGLTACSSPPTAGLPSSTTVLLPDLTRDLAPLPADEYRQRIERLRHLLSENGVSAFLVEAGSTLNYFTGVSWWKSERPFVAVIGLRGPVVCIAPAFEEERAREQIGPDVELRTWQEDADPYALIGKSLQDLEVRTGTVAVDPETRVFVYGGVSLATPALGLQVGERYPEQCRILKSAREIEYLRIADRITKQAYRAAIAELREGISEEEFGEHISAAHRQQGSRGGALVLFGANSALPHGSNQPARLRFGDVALMDGGCSVQGYRSDVTRSAVFGKASDLQKRIWETVFQAQTAALEAIRPGVSCGEIDSVARRVIEEAGYGPDYRFFTHRLGHGIGLDGHEPPYIVRGNPLKLEAGMAFSVEPGIYLPGQWGIRHEDIVVVTEDGCEVLGDRASTVSI